MLVVLAIAAPIGMYRRHKLKQTGASQAPEVVSPPEHYQNIGFEGRLPRKHYWMGLILASTPGRALDDVSGWPWEQVAAALSLAILAYTTMIATRRLHDFGLSGWWQAPVRATHLAILLIGQLAPIDALKDVVGENRKAWGLGLVVFGASILVFDLVIGLVPGTKKANRYGEAVISPPLFSLSIK